MINKYVIEFIIYSFFGWCWESILSIVKNGKWEARGFLIGPICPIYCISIIIGYILLQYLPKLIESNFIYLSVFCFIVSAIIEYITSWLLEKLFNAVWWDYKDIPLNINGRISLFTSIGFGIAGSIIILYLIPYTKNLISLIDKNLLEIIAYIIIILVSIDTTLTVNELVDINTKITSAENSFNNKMSELVEQIIDKPNLLKNTLY